MHYTFDLVLKGGSVVDGSGAAPFIADVAVKDGFIAAIGEVRGTARRQIDAQNMLVTPGFVDIHTHYDGQALWSDRIAPSSAHGVTTVVMGNCGVGFAPCRALDHAKLVDLMEGVEDIPEIVMTEGLPWNWETFPEYLDALDRVPHDIDIAAYLPHSPLRMFVMGDRALAREQATPDDIRQMQKLVREAMDAGAVGFATSRVILHRTARGNFIPSYDAGWDELEAIGTVLAESGRGIFQIANLVSGDELDRELGRLKRLSVVMKRPVMLATTQMTANPNGWQRMIQMLDEINTPSGPRIVNQTFPRPVGMIVGHSASNNPFRLCPSYVPLAQLPLVEKMAELRKPELRSRLIAEAPTDATNPVYLLCRDFTRIFELAEIPNYEPRAEDSVAARAVRLGVSPAELAYDLLLQEDGRALLYVAVANYADQNLDFLETLMPHKDTVIGLGDGGAHYGMICDSSYTTFMLTHWTRDRAGKHFSVPQIINMLARRNAEVMGLYDRGLIAPGYKADINVIDYDKIKLYRPFIVRDLPGGGQRLDQRADGYIATIVSGQVIAEHGVPTTNRPGKLVRGSPKPKAPQAAAA